VIRSGSFEKKIHKGVQHIIQTIIFGKGKIDISNYQYPNSYQEDQRPRALILFLVVSFTFNDQRITPLLSTNSKIRNTIISFY